MQLNVPKANQISMNINSNENTAKNIGYSSYNPASTMKIDKQW